MNIRNSKSISVLVPLYNKEQLIQNTIKQVSTLLENCDYEILVIENGSTDNSKAKLLEVISENKNINIEMLESNKGLGNALKKGIRNARKDFVIAVPADFTTGTAEINYFLENEKFSYVIGSRSISNINSPGILRKLLSFTLRVLNKLLLNIKVKDTQFSFIIETKIAKDLEKSCQSSGFYITAELIYFALKNKIEIIEIPVQIKENKKNQTTINFLSDSFDVFFDIIKIYLKNGRL